MNSKKLAIFDMDGTILDTLEDLTDAVNHILGKCGLPGRSISEVRQFVGNGTRKLMERIFPAGTPADEIDAYASEFSLYYRDHGNVKTRPYDGICEMLRELRKAGVMTACVSNKIDPGVKMLCSELFPGLFDLAIGDRPGQALKPAPDSVLAVLNELGVKKEDAVYIGDSETDMKTAENAGLRMIAVLWGFRDIDVLKKAHAKKFAATADELKDIILKMLFRKKEFELTFLGTGAAYRDPRALPGGEFEHSFTKLLRRNTSAILNRHCLIDCGAFTVSSLSIIGKPLSEITDVFFTHLHGDHYREDAVAEVAAARKTPLRVWVREDAVFPDIPNVELHRMPDRTTLDTPCGFTVTGLRSNHDQKYAPQYLLFEAGEKKFLYATDGAWMLFETFYYLRNAHLDLLCWDFTVGDDPRNFRMAEHNSLPMLRLMKGSLEDFNTIDEHTEIWLTHLGDKRSCRHLGSHDEIEAQVSAEGFRLAYDGVTIEV